MTEKAPAELVRRGRGDAVSAKGDRSDGLALLGGDHHGSAGCHDRHQAVHHHAGIGGLGAFGLGGSGGLLGGHGDPEAVADLDRGVAGEAQRGVPGRRDERGAVSLAAVLFVALVRIPLGTVVLEELAFRGVLPALVGGGWWRATLVSSGLFGLWHVLPSMGASPAVTAALGTSGAVVGTVLFTTAAGVVFRAWQRWSGHLVTPMLLHAVTNSLGVLIAWWVSHRS